MAKMRPRSSGKPMFGGNRRCLSSSCGKRACPVLREQAGFRFGVLLVFRAVSSLCGHRLDLPLTEIEGGGLPPSKRLTLRRKVSQMLRLWPTGQSNTKETLQSSLSKFKMHESTSQGTLEMEVGLPVFLDGMEKPTRVILYETCAAVRGRDEDTGTVSVRTNAGGTTDWESRVRSRAVQTRMAVPGAWRGNTAPLSPDALRRARAFGHWITPSGVLLQTETEEVRADGQLGHAVPERVFFHFFFE